MSPAFSSVVVFFLLFRLPLGLPSASSTHPDCRVIFFLLLRSPLGLPSASLVHPDCQVAFFFLSLATGVSQCELDAPGLSGCLFFFAHHWDCPVWARHTRIAGSSFYYFRSPLGLPSVSSTHLDCWAVCFSLPTTGIAQCGLDAPGLPGCPHIPFVATGISQCEFNAPECLGCILFFFARFQGCPSVRA